MERVLSVSQLNNYIKRMFDGDFVLKQVYVKGEASNVKYHSSGHIYFTIKDRNSAMAAVMFAGNRRGLGFRMAEGDQIVALGSISVYERDGKYQLYAREIQRDGEGVLFARFNELKEQLQKEGLFDEDHKLPIPPYAKTVGIVTAETGAAIQDIINVTTRRNPYIQLVLYPALVQGEGAAVTICRGIRTLEKKGVDLIIVGRGGGSIEDLWAFNEEIVARTIYDCKVPIISAVGHETDFTIADFVSDRRAPTPSAAAELASWDYSRFVSDLEGYEYELLRTITDKIRSLKKKKELLEARLKRFSPESRLFQNKQEYAELARRLSDAIDKKLTDYRHRYELLLEQMKGLSPLNKLGGGYAFVRKGSKSVKSVNDIKDDDVLRISFKDGEAKAKVIETVEVER